MRRMRERTANRAGLWLALAAWGALAAHPAVGIEFRGGQHVVVGPDEVIDDDLYVTGETVTVAGRIEGDMVASGREVRLSGVVTGDLVAAGQTVVVDGQVADDARIAGMALRLGPEAVIGDDVVFAGLSLETSPGSSAGGSLLFKGFQALLEGELGEGLLGSMSALEVRGGIGGNGEIVIEGDADMPPFIQYIPSPVTLPVVPGGLTVADTARIDGELVYTSASEARGSGTGPGRLIRREPGGEGAEAREKTREPSWPARLSRMLGLIVLGLLLARWAPGWLRTWSGEIRSRPLPLGGIGVAGVVALPVVILMALASLVVLAILLGVLKLGNLAALVLVLGLVVLGLLLLLFWLTSAYLAPVLVGLTTGQLLLERFAPDKARGLVLPLVAGLVLLALLWFVPILGGLIAALVLLLGWGAILQSLWRRSRAAVRR